MQLEEIKAWKKTIIYIKVEVRKWRAMKKQKEETIKIRKMKRGMRKKEEIEMERRGWRAMEKGRVEETNMMIKKKREMGLTLGMRRTNI